MKKKYLLTLMVITLSMLTFSTINVSAETYENLTYSITNGKVAITDCDKSATNIVIPETIENYPVTSIGSLAFSGCRSLEYVTIPDSVTSIGYFAFGGCSNLTSATMGNGVTRIGNSAFNGCSSLEYVTIPNSVTSIGNQAFYRCSSLEYVTIPNSVTSIGHAAFSESSLKSVTIPDSVTSISGSVFSYCQSLKSVTIPNSVTSIGNYAFAFCRNLETVYYNGNYGDWDKISIGSDNAYLSNATKNFFLYVVLLNNNGDEISKKIYDIDGLIDISNIEEKFEHTIHLYTDKELQNEYLITTPIRKNLTLYLHYVINQYTAKFLDEDGTLLEEKLVDYGATITLPANPSKPTSQQYTYTFAGWEGYEDGITQQAQEMLFRATYTATINQYTYKFVDEDGSVLKEETVDYGTTITPPEINDKTEYYLFDYWQDYVEGMTVTKNVTFNAVYKYKNYSVTAEGLSEPIIVIYNSNFVIEPQKIDDYHYFIGYFTEENGKGTQITNEKGESLSVYNIIGDLKVYPYFYEGYMNKVELQCIETAMPGDTITQKAIFATDKNATYFIATIKYPKYLNFKSIKGIDFKEANKDSEKVVGDYKYLDITCVFDYEGNFVEINTNYIPFEIEFDIATDAPLRECEISIGNVVLIGDDTFEITDIKNHTLTILSKLAESVEIIGSDEIDKATQFRAIVSPDYTTDKAVMWSINDETVAIITQDGTVTPVKNGTVIITATAKDGSEVFATKTVNVLVYAKINSLDFGGSVVLTEFNPDVRKYTVYVKENATSISLTPTFSGGGVLRPNGSGVWVSGRSKDFELNDAETTITLNRENVTDMTDSVYTIKVIRFEGTKTTVSEDKKSFTITPINIKNGKTVILALYNGEQFVEMQSAVYTGEAVPFTTTKTYTKAKVMVWDDLTNLKPVCEVEEIN